MSNIIYFQSEDGGILICDYCGNIPTQIDHLYPKLECGHVFCSMCGSKYNEIGDLYCHRCDDFMLVKSLISIGIDQYKYPQNNSTFNAQNVYLNCPSGKNLETLEIKGDTFRSLQSKANNNLLNEVFEIENKDAIFCESHNQPKEKWCRQCQIWVCNLCSVWDHHSYPKGHCLIYDKDTALDYLRQKSHLDSSEMLIKLCLIQERILDFQNMHRRSARFFNKLKMIVKSDLLDNEVGDNSCTLWLEKINSLKMKLCQSDSTLNGSTDKDSILLALDSKSKGILHHIEEHNLECQLHTLVAGQSTLLKILPFLERMYAVELVETDIKYAKMTIESYYLMIHPFTDSQPLLDSIYVRYNDILERINLEFDLQIAIDVYNNNVDTERILLDININEEKNPFWKMIFNWTLGKTGLCFLGSNLFNQQKHSIIFGHTDFPKYKFPDDFPIVERAENEFIPGDVFISFSIDGIDQCLNITTQKHTASGLKIGSLKTGFNILNAEVDKKIVNDCGLLLPLKALPTIL